MASTKKYRTVIPVEPGSDMAVVRWLVRESFDVRAAWDGLQIDTFTEVELSATDLTPTTTTKQQTFGSRLFQIIFNNTAATEYQWYEFSAVASA